MAIFFTDACDSYGVPGVVNISDKWDVTQSTTYITWESASGRFGGGSISVQGDAGFYGITKTFPVKGSAASTDELFIGWSFMPNVGADNNARLVTLCNTLTPPSSSFNASEYPTMLSLKYNSSGTFSLLRAGTVIATGTTVYPPGSWYRLELRAVVSNTGLFELRVDGVAEITFSGDTYDAGTLGICQLILWVTLDSETDDWMFWDSVARQDEPVTWVGDIRMDTLRPTANGDVIDSTPLAGAAYAAVDEVSRDNNTTYTQADTIGNKDLYVMSDLPSTPTSILAVVVNIQAEASGTTNRQMKAKVKHTSESDGDNVVLAKGVYKLSQAAFSRDPATGAAWDGAAVNAAQIGWEVVL